MSAAQKELRLAVQKDIQYLWTRLPHPTRLREQLREMIEAESRAQRYDVIVPWRNGQWYGINVPKTVQEVDKSGIVVSQSTGGKAGRQKERKR